MPAVPRVVRSFHCQVLQLLREKHGHPGPHALSLQIVVDDAVHDVTILGDALHLLGVAVAVGREAGLLDVRLDVPAELVLRLRSLQGAALVVEDVDRVSRQGVGDDVLLPRLIPDVEVVLQQLLLQPVERLLVDGRKVRQGLVVCEELEAPPREVDLPVVDGPRGRGQLQQVRGVVLLEALERARRVRHDPLLAIHDLCQDGAQTTRVLLITLRSVGCNPPLTFQGWVLNYWVVTQRRLQLPERVGGLQRQRALLVARVCFEQIGEVPGRGREARDHEAKVISHAQELSDLLQRIRLWELAYGAELLEAGADPVLAQVIPKILQLACCKDRLFHVQP